jgi:hypothetical protein
LGSLLGAKLAVVERQALHERGDGSVEIPDRAVASDLEFDVTGLVADGNQAVAGTAVGCGSQSRLDHPIGDEIDAWGQVDWLADGLPVAR